MLIIKHPILMLGFKIWLGLLLIQCSTCEELAESTSVPNTTDASTTIKAPASPKNTDDIVEDFSPSDCKNTTDRPREEKACEIWNKYRHLNKAKTDDCGFEETNKYIAFMQTFAFEHPGKDEQKLWKHRTNMHRFRRFMENEGFLKNPGTIKFRLHNEKTMKLFCGNKKDESDKKHDTGFKWTAEGTKDDKEWNKDASDKRREIFKAAPSYLYIQKYKCESKKLKCKHTFYVITRPYPSVSKHIQIYEGGSGELVCEVPKCLYDDSLKDCTDFTKGRLPLFYPPMEFYFIFPRHLELEIRKTSDLTSSKALKSEYPDTKISFHEKSSFKVPKNRTLKSPKENDLDKVDYYRKAKIVFDKVTKDKHDGLYECVFTDYNGVTSSSPKQDPTEKPIKKEGVRHVHVRPWYWLFIAISIVCVVPIFSIIIEFCCKRRMEHDDGTRYTEEELAFYDQVKKDGKKAIKKPTPQVSEVNLDKDPSAAQVSTDISEDTVVTDSAK